MTQRPRPQRGDLRLPLMAADPLINQPIVCSSSIPFVPLAWALLPLIVTAVTVSTGAAACGSHRAWKGNAVWHSSVSAANPSFCCRVTTEHVCGHIVGDHKIPLTFKRYTGVPIKIRRRQDMANSAVFLVLASAKYENPSHSSCGHVQEKYLTQTRKKQPLEPCFLFEGRGGEGQNMKTWPIRSGSRKEPRRTKTVDVLLRWLDEVGYVAPTVVVDYKVGLCRWQNFSIIE